MSVKTIFLQKRDGGAGKWFSCSASDVLVFLLIELMKSIISGEIKISWWIALEPNVIILLFFCCNKNGVNCCVLNEEV